MEYDGLVIGGAMQERPGFSRVRHQVVAILDGEKTECEPLRHSCVNWLLAVGNTAYFKVEQTR